MAGSDTTWHTSARRSAGEAGLVDLLAAADVRVDGDRPWDIQVHDRQLFRRILADGSLGAGEAYVEGWWDCQRLDELFDRLVRARLHERLRAWSTVWRSLLAR